MPIYLLLMMKIFTGRNYCTAVGVSCMVMITDASPAMSMTSESGCASCTPPVAHGAEAARGPPACRLLAVIELRRPHLVLADFGGDVGVAVLGQLEQPLDGVLRLDDVVRAAIGERLFRPPLRDLVPPSGKRLLVRLCRTRTPCPQHLLDHVGAIADNRQIDLDVLVD